MYRTPARRPRALVVVLALLAGTLAAVAGPLALPAAAVPQARAATATAAAASTYGAPSWWDGDCDTINWTRKARAAGWTGEAAHRLGGEVLGIPVCGPRNLAGAPNVWWSRSGWGELEWQCVEFAQRFMIQVYGVSPYQANGVDVVNHYTSAQGGGLVKVTNGTVGKAPQPGDVMSFSSPSNAAGHVAVVASSTVDANGDGSIRLATQNDTVDGWRTLTVSDWKVASFGTLYPYGWLHDPQGRGGGSSALKPVDGDYVAYDGAVYRIAGGAPVYVSSWDALGGAKPTIALTGDQFAALRDTPRDGTFLRDPTTAAMYRVAGGAPVPITTCAPAAMNGCHGSVDVDPAAIAGAGSGGRFDHLRASVSDGTLIRRADDARGGWIGVAVGTSLLPVTNCDLFDGCAGWVDIDYDAVTRFLAAHPTPVDGTVVVGRPSGRSFAWSGGRCTTGSGAGGAPVSVDDAALTSCTGVAVGSSPSGLLVAGRRSDAVLTAAGGSGRYSWSLESGDLPAGLRLTTDGHLRGTAAATGTSTVRVRAVDLGDPSASVTGTVTVVVVAPLTPATDLPPMQVGTAVSATLTASGGTAPYRWALVKGALPAGVTLGADGSLTGTPTRAGHRSATVRVSDASGQQVSVTVDVDVTSARGGAAAADPTAG